LNKRKEYLGLADFDYLSARLLLLSGLATTGFPLAAQAIEKLLKIFLLLYEKRINNRVVTKIELIREWKHRLTKLFKYLNQNIDVPFDSTWDHYLQKLEDAYKKRRYPEDWTKHKYDVEVVTLDKVYCYLRNITIAYFPEKEKEEVRKLGTFIYNAYTEENKDKIKEWDGIPPDKLFYLRNESAKDFNIDFNHL